MAVEQFIISLQFPGYQYLCGLQSSTFSLLLPTSYISSTSIRCMYTAAQVRSGVMSSPLSRWLPSPPPPPPPQISLPVGTSAMVANISLIWTNSGTVMYPIDPLGVIQGEDMRVHRRRKGGGGGGREPTLLQVWGL